jgi:hypothetical protein
MSDTFRELYLEEISFDNDDYYFIKISKNNDEIKFETDKDKDDRFCKRRDIENENEKESCIKKNKDRFKEINSEQRINYKYYSIYSNVSFFTSSEKKNKQLLEYFISNYNKNPDIEYYFKHHYMDGSGMTSQKKKTYYPIGKFDGIGICYFTGTGSQEKCIEDFSLNKIEYGESGPGERDHLSDKLVNIKLYNPTEIDKNVITNFNLQNMKIKLKEKPHFEKTYSKSKKNDYYNNGSCKLYWGTLSLFFKYRDHDTIAYRFVKWENIFGPLSKDVVPKKKPVEVQLNKNITGGKIRYSVKRRKKTRKTVKNRRQIK